MSDHISKSKRFIFYLIVFSLTAGICLVVVEFGLATYYHSTDDQISYTTFDLTLGWRLRPGTYWVKPSHTFRRHQVQINEYGLRNGRITGPAKDVRRVIFLGDSFTFGLATRTEDTFPVLLENLLNRTGHYEVINAGVPGYGTAQEMLFMKELSANNITAEIYVLMIFINDILDNLRLGEYGSLTETPAQPGFVVAQNGQLLLTHHPHEGDSANRVSPRRMRFLTFDVLRNRITTFLQTKPALVSVLNKLGIEATLLRMPSLIYGWYREDILASGVPLTKALLKAIQGEANKNHALILAVIIPSPLQVYADVYSPILRHTFPNNELVESYLNDPKRPQRIISEVSRDLKIPIVDLHPILIENNDKELFIPADGHFSADGHAIVARRLEKFIMETVNSGH